MLGSTILIVAAFRAVASVHLLPRSPHGWFAWCQQVALLRAHAGEHLILGVAYRSLSLNDVLLLSNDSVITRQSQDLDIGRIASRVLDELVLPMRDVIIDDTEFACMKTIVFFDPGSDVFLLPVFVKCFLLFSAIFAVKVCQTSELTTENALFTLKCNHQVIPALMFLH